jgi:hypothetical protein
MTMGVLGGVIGFRNRVIAALQAGNTIINKQGVFIYNGTPGTGNLIFSIASGTHDKFGNLLVPTASSYVPGDSPTSPVASMAVGEFRQSIPATTLNHSRLLIQGNATSQFVNIESGNSIAGEAQSVLTLADAGVIGQPGPTITGNGAFRLPGIAWVPPSGDATGATDPARIQPLLNLGITSVHLLPGQFYGNTFVEVPGDAELCGSGQQITNWQVVTGSALQAAFATAGWTGSTNTGAVNPVNVHDFTINANNAANYGYVSQNFWSKFDSLTIFNALSDGFRFDQLGANGVTALTGTAVENRVTNCQFRSCAGNGLRVNDPTHNVFTDGWLTDCAVQSSGVNGVRIDSGAGWKVEGNHVYGSPMSGIRVDRPFMTRIRDNYVESFGSSAVAGQYCGVDCFNGFVADTGYGSVIAGNTIYLTDTPASGSVFSAAIGIAASSGANATFSLAGNVLHSAVVSTTVNAVNMHNQSGTSTMQVALGTNQITGAWGGGIISTPGTGTSIITLPPGQSY